MILLNQFLNKEDFAAIVQKKQKISLDESLRQRFIANHEFLKDFSVNKVIYGVNTGFGPMAQYRVADEDVRKLQYNLIRSHAAGAGGLMPLEDVRATMVARLSSLCQVKSGINISVVNVLTQLLNKDIYPVIFRHGGVGSSGDLVQLSHLALALIGEGEVIYKNKRQPTAEVFQQENIQPIDIKIREGLALINGTSAMTGIGLLNHYNANKILDWCLTASIIINEIVTSYDDHFSKELNGAKRHDGQAEIARRMRQHLDDSQLTKKRDHHLYNGKRNESTFKEKVQEYYSIRCVPQILGPILDTLNYTGKILEDELNSANDNPIIDSEAGSVFHGGNFHGDYISLEMDKMKLGVTRMSMLAERQLNFLLNPKINDILPPFVTRGTLGLNYGIQGMQFTATSTTAENQMLSNSMYVHSIPCNNDNQDIVSMGTNAAQITEQVIDNAFQVLGVEILAIYQAVRHLNNIDQLSSQSRTIIKKLEEFVPDIIEDDVAYPIINNIIKFLKY